MSNAARNAQIKKTLTAVFGPGKVRVRGSRGTGYGYVRVDIDFTPVDMDQYRELSNLCTQLLIKKGVNLGRAYTDDTCQFETDMCHINLNQPRYFRAMRPEDGSMSVLREYMGEWEAA